MRKKPARPKTIPKPRSLDLLGLPGIEPASAETHQWFVNHKKVSALEVSARAQSVIPETCPSCQANSKFVGNGSRLMDVKDVPQGRMHVVIKLLRPRVKCVSCGFTITMTPDVVHPKHRMTWRLYNDIQILGLKYTFAQVSFMTGVDQKTIATIVYDFIPKLNALIPFVAPEVIGIDEVHGGVLKAAFLVVTDILNRQLLELSDTGKSIDEVKRVITTMSDNSRVRYGVTDMCWSYHSAITTSLPVKGTIVDKRHVLELSRKALATVRKQVKMSMRKENRKYLERERGILNKRRHQLTDHEKERIIGWCKRFPRLGAAYDLKEAFYDIYDYAAAEDALAAFDAWAASIPENLEKEFGSVRNTFWAYQDQILAYFTTGKKITNAPTEAINGLIKQIKRNGRGYSFEVLRAKALHNHGRWNEEEIHKYLHNEG